MSTETEEIYPQEKAKYLNWLMPDVAKRFVALKIQEWIDNDEPSILSRTYSKSFWETVNEYL